MNDIGLVIPDSFHKREVIHQHVSIGTAALIAD
uniref:Transposase n=1 Tax=Ascaris lumbricoides TaxID=6252 RepID=A0A0M3IIF9_ASCLU